MLRIRKENLLIAKRSLPVFTHVACLRENAFQDKLVLAIDLFIAAINI